MNEITRFPDVVSITAASAAGTTTPRIAFSRFAGGCVIVGASNGATQVAWYGASSSDATPVQVYADGAAVTTAVTVGVLAIPDACFALPFIAPVVTGTSACTMTVCLKG